MMKVIKGKQQWDPKKPLNVHVVLNLVTDIIIKDIKEGITTHSEDIHGDPFEELLQDTIDSKRKKGYKHPEKPLFAKGKMKEVYLRKPATASRLVATIGINKRDRLAASGAHQEGSMILPTREWVGVSTRAIPKINKLTMRMLKKELRIRG